MKKLKVLLIILVIINIVFSSILISNIQLFKSPDIKVDIDILDINSEEIQLGSNVTIFNSNSFDLIVSDLEILSKTENGEKIGTIFIEGGRIPANTKKRFYSKDNLSFKNDTFEVIENIVSATVGINTLGFITKTLPLKIKASISVKKVFDALIPPEVKIDFEFDDITNKGFNFSTSVDIYNPTDFEFSIHTIHLDITNKQNETLGKIEFSEGKINAKSSKVFSSKGIIYFQAFDSEILLLKLSGIAGAKIAGITKNISFSSEASFHIPNIKSFIFVNETVEFSIPVQFKLTPFGLRSTVGLKIYNPSEVILVADNLVCTISRLDKDKLSILGQEDMQVCEIAPKKTTCIQTQILIPYTTYLFSGSKQLLADWIVLKVTGDFFIAGTQQSIPISLSAYVDPHFIRNSDFTARTS